MIINVCAHLRMLKKTPINVNHLGFNKCTLGPSRFLLNLYRCKLVTCSHKQSYAALAYGRDSEQVAQSDVLFCRVVF